MLSTLRRHCRRMVPGQLRPRPAIVLALPLALVLGLATARDVSAQPTPTPIDTTKPLGSFENPILTRGPSGEAEYIARMRCPDGTAVRVVTRGSRGAGPHGHIIDVYELRCEAQSTTHTVHMDMYHGEGDRERRPVAPLGVLAEHPARLADGCPPRVVADADSSARYVFIWWEVQKPVRATNPVTRITWPTYGTVPFSFIIDRNGAIEPGSVVTGAVRDTAMLRVASERLPTLTFDAAEHRPGCHVRQRSGVTFTFAPQ